MENEDCDADRPYKTVGDELCERSSTITAPDKGIQKSWRVAGRITKVILKRI